MTMKADRWKEIDSLFHAALEREPAERACFMTQACAGDEALRKEVESLIASHERAGGFIEAPAADLAAELMAKSPENAVGRTIGPYRVVDLLGAGGMGEVYLAEDTRLGRRVALKLLPAQFTQDALRLRRFEREARAASALNHPNILVIYDTGNDSGAHFIVTEFVEGETLRQRMARSRMGLGEIVEIAMQVTCALAATHQAGIIHRDIKPENIMIRPDGYIKLLDFGLAKLTESAGNAGPKPGGVDTSAGLVMGTVTYMSPEQARGRAVDARSDIFSLGSVLYEMITGRVPFEGETNFDVLVSLLEKEPPALALQVPEMPAEWDRIVKKAMAKDCEGRYQTANDLLIDLRNLKQDFEPWGQAGSGRANKLDERGVRDDKKT
jgi:serine/threonine protein kinase